MSIIYIAVNIFSMFLIEGRVVLFLSMFSLAFKHSINDLTTLEKLQSLFILFLLFLS